MRFLVRPLAFAVVPLLSAVAACSGPASSDAAGSGGALPPSGGAPSGGQASGGVGLGPGGAASGGELGSGGAASGGELGSGGLASGGGASGGAPSGGGSGSSSGGGLGAGGGAATATTICATGPEDTAVVLECPEGQVIESVVFASYGTPSAECPEPAVGECHSEDSESIVAERCIGRDRCSIAATNGAFGDPCQAVTKSLTVQAQCVPGVPIATDEPFKGVANSPAAEIEELGASWCYNWESKPKASDCGDPLFVPMIWGSNNVGEYAAIRAAGYKTLLGFNEPNKTDQANLSVDEAVALWPSITSDPTIRVSSPAVSDDGRAWLEEFMDRAEAEGLRVDFVAMHWYGWNAGSCTAGNLNGAVNWASKWGKPVWVTEFGCMGSSNPDEQTLLNFFQAAIPQLEGNAKVERYAWYPWNTYNHLFESGQITALGELFQAAAPSR